MPSNWFPLGLRRIIAEGLDTMTPTIALMSVEGTQYVFGSTHEFFDTGTNNNADPSFCETAATDYVRKVVSPTVQLDAGNSRIEIIIADQTWTALGNGTNETIGAAILFDDSGVLTTSPLLAYWDITNTITTDQDYTLDFDDANGNLRIPYVIA